MELNDCLTKTQNNANFWYEVCGLRPARWVIIKFGASHPVQRYANGGCNSDGLKVAKFLGR